MKHYKLLSLLTFSLLLNSCGENTITPITTDVNRTNGMLIDTPLYPLYSTSIYTPKATVSYMDGTSADATNGVGINWIRSDSSLIYLSNDLTVLPLKNDGNSTLSVSYKSNKYFDNSITLDIVGITDINGTNKTWDIIDLDSNTTGTHNLVAEGNFTNGDTDIVLERNIIWTSVGASASIGVDSNYNTSINITGTGDINITATLFTDINATITKTYTIN